MNIWYVVMLVQVGLQVQTRCELLNVGLNVKEGLELQRRASEVCFPP